MSNTWKPKSELDEITLINLAKSKDKSVSMKAFYGLKQFWSDQAIKQERSRIVEELRPHVPKFISKLFMKIINNEALENNER